MKRRTKPALYLHPYGNNQGGDYFMKIDNGERVHKNRITVIPMPEKIDGDGHRFTKQQKYLKEGL